MSLYVGAFTGSINIFFQKINVGYIGNIIYTYNIKVDVIIPEYIKLIHLYLLIYLSKEKSSRFMAENTTHPCSAVNRSGMFYKVTRLSESKVDSL